MNDAYAGAYKFRPRLTGGYMFLDVPNGTEGLIRLYSGHCNPKWSFWIDKSSGKLCVDMA